MSAARTLRAVASFALLAAAAAALQGCICFPSSTRATTGALLPEDRVAALRPGATTAAEVLDWFGPPLAVARGPEGTIQVPEVVYRRSGAAELEAAALFAKFGAGAAAPGDLVYYYRLHQVVTRGSGVILVVGNKGDLVGTSRNEDRDERLWLLVDGGTGLVKARVHERDEPRAEPRREEPAGEAP